jgi:3-methyladenine DNA glycosylase Mpg
VIVSTPRIGIDYAAEPWSSAPLRLLVADSTSVSHAPAGRRRRSVPATGS